MSSFDFQKKRLLTDEVRTLKTAIVHPLINGFAAVFLTGLTITMGVASHWILFISRNPDPPIYFVAFVLLIFILSAFVMYKVLFLFFYFPYWVRIFPDRLVVVYPFRLTRRVLLVDQIREYELEDCVMGKWLNSRSVLITMQDGTTIELVDDFLRGFSNLHPALRGAEIPRRKKRGIFTWFWRTYQDT